MNIIAEHFLDKLKPLNNNSKRDLTGYIFHTKENINNIINSSNQPNSNKKTLKIEEIGLLKDMNQNELEKYILNIINNNESIDQIDLSNIIDNKEIHSHIYNIIGRNFPALEISRLIPGQKIVDLTFLGVKDLNDKVSKEVVDLFIGKFKNVINNNFDKIISGEKPGRLIRNEYKHLTFSILKELDISKKLFGGEKSKENLINQVLSDISSEELIKALKEGGKSNLTRKETEELLKNIFDFGIGTSVVPEGTENSNENPLYMAERASRKKADLNDLGENISFNFKEIKENAKNALQTEKYIISKYYGIKFNNDGIDFDIIVNGKINPLLLKYVRKDQNITVKGDSKTLKFEILEYITYLTNGFDFISSIINENDFNNTEGINKQISTGKIDMKLFINNYKGTLSKEALLSSSKGKQGLRMFIDIVDMGIMNLTDFRDLAGKVDSGEITEENIDELLKSGNTATNKFQKLVKNIKKLYPEAKISLGGDEIFIFIPGKTEDEKNEIIKDIALNLDNLTLKGRISTSFNKDNEKIYDNLDNITSINKLFEKGIEQTINLNILKEKPSVTSLDITDEKVNLINTNLNYFLHLLTINIKKSDIKDLTIYQKSILENIEYEIKDMEGNLIKGKLSIEVKNINNLITIKIK